MAKKTLYIMIGPPGVGKSTYIRKCFFNLNNNIDYIKLVSRDKIRFDMVDEKEDYFSKEKAVYRKFIYEIKQGLLNPEISIVIADATHITRKSRAKLFGMLKDLKGINYTVIGIYINTPIEEAIRQNGRRIGTRRFVPPNVIQDMFSKFEEPKLEEGFDEIYYTSSDLYYEKIICKKKR